MITDKEYINGGKDLKQFVHMISDLKDGYNILKKSIRCKRNRIVF